MDFKKLMVDQQAATIELARISGLSVDEVKSKSSYLSMAVVAIKRFYQTFSRFPTENEAKFAWQFSVEQLIAVLNDPKRTI